MKPTHVLVVGASGSIGRHAVEKARAAGYRVRALVRDPSRIHFGCGVEVVQGDLTSVESMRQALDGIDGIVFTHGSNGGPTLTETVDYGAVRNALEALDGRPARIALMTSIGVTNMDNDYNRSTEAHDWKRHSERLVRASGNEYTIVRPGWFDMEGADEHQLKFEQGDRRDPMGPQDGSAARRQVAQTLVDALGCKEADHKTLELIDVAGTAQTDAELASMFARTATRHRTRRRAGPRQLPRVHPAQARTRADRTHRDDARRTVSRPRSKHVPQHTSPH